MLKDLMQCQFSNNNPSFPGLRSCEGSQLAAFIATIRTGSQTRGVQTAVALCSINYESGEIAFGTPPGGVSTGIQPNA